MKRVLPAITAVLILLISCVSYAAEFVPLAANSSVTVASLSVDGPYEIRSILTPSTAEYRAATIYFPIDADLPVGGVAISPGYTQSQRNINWWGSRLASHGFAVLTLDTNEPFDRPETRAVALIAALDIMKTENRRRPTGVSFPVIFPYP